MMPSKMLDVLKKASSSKSLVIPRLRSGGSPGEGYVNFLDDLDLDNNTLRLDLGLEGALYVPLDEILAFQVKPDVRRRPPRGPSSR